MGTAIALHQRQEQHQLCRSGVAGDAQAMHPATQGVGVQIEQACGALRSFHHAVGLGQRPDNIVAFHLVKGARRSLAGHRGHRQPGGRDHQRRTPRHNSKTCQRSAVKARDHANNTRHNLHHPAPSLHPGHAAGGGDSADRTGPGNYYSGGVRMAE